MEYKFLKGAIFEECSITLNSTDKKFVLDRTKNEECFSPSLPNGVNQYCVSMDNSYCIINGSKHVTDGREGL